MERHQSSWIEGDMSAPDSKSLHPREPYDYKESEHTPEQRKVREFLNSIDEPVLREIFAELSRKAGKDPNFLNFVPIAEVRIKQGAGFEEGSRVGGSYSSGDGITIYTGSIDVGTLWTLVHEELHAISEGEERVIDGSNNETSLIIYAGLRREYVDFSDGKILEVKENFRNCNEGFTEFLTCKIVDEYMRQTGADKTIKIDAEIYKDIHDLYSEYDKHKWLIEFYIDVLSAIAGVPVEVVENSMTRLYIRNGFLLPNEVEEELAIFNNELPYDLWSLLLAGGWNETKVLDFYKKLNTSDKFSEQQSAALLQALRETIYKK
jgi:hypothetical protein